MKNTKLKLISSKKSLSETVLKIVEKTPVTDIHTHLYHPAFKNLLLYGIDELLVYHYLVSEAFRFADIPFSKFWELEKKDQAEIVWQNLFVKNTPISEAARGVITTLNLLGIDPRKHDLPALRKKFNEWKIPEYIDTVLSLANVKSLYTTNSPFDPEEVKIWQTDPELDPRFISGLRIDPIILDWPNAYSTIRDQGFDVSPTINEPTILNTVKFLEHWLKKTGAKYLMVSTPPDFLYPAKTLSTNIIDNIILPFCRDNDLPFAMMMGVKRQINPALRLAGDAVASANLNALEEICAKNTKNKFLVTVLAREDQHRLCVIARKFRNLHPFGCWWFTNVPSLISEITTMRLELLGTNFTAQHSDARVLDQLIYKWSHSRKVIANVLINKYSELMDSGWQFSESDIQNDVLNLFGEAFNAFVKLKL
jgi:hypothetical protein